MRFQVEVENVERKIAQNILLKKQISIYPSGQSYDCELKRQRCKNLQRHELPSAFKKQK
jgi:hypothetical protein